MLTLLLLACPHLEPWPVEDTGPGPGERIAVSPRTIDFGPVSVNLQGSATRTITLYNLGDEPVTVTGQDEPIGDEAAFRVDALPVLTLEGGEERELEITFLPSTEEDALARLRFDPGSEVVELLGRGTAPVLRVVGVDVPATVLGCTGSGTVTVQNNGSEPLTLSATTTSSGFAVTGWPEEVLAGESDTLDVTFTPDGSGARTGLLTLTTNDPARPQVAVDLDALGYEGERVRERFVYAPSAPTDVFLAVAGDSFADDPRLPEALETYAQRLHDAWPDVRLTSLGSGSACPADMPKWATAADSVLTIEEVLSHGFIAPGGAWDHDLVDLVERALFEAEPGGCLDGVREPGAALDVIFVSADPADGDAVADFAALANGLPDGTKVRVSALVPRTGECGALSNDYADIADSYDGPVGDLCAASWTAAFAAFAALPVVLADAHYPLAELPVVSSISVTADGVAFTGWTYDPAENRIVIGTVNPPAVGAELTVNYVSAVSCSG